LKLDLVLCKLGIEKLPILGDSIAAMQKMIELDIEITVDIETEDSYEGKKFEEEMEKKSEESKYVVEFERLLNKLKWLKLIRLFRLKLWDINQPPKDCVLEEISGIVNIWSGLKDLQLEFCRHRFTESCVM